MPRRSPDDRHYVFHYEKVDVDYSLVHTALMGAGLPPEGAIPEDRTEFVRLDTRGANDRSAGCVHAVTPQAAPNRCWVHPDLGRWEIGWGTDAF